ANVVWSCNTKDTMSGMSRDDRRFKIVPIAVNKLFGAPIFDVNNKQIGVFTPTIVNNLTNSEEFKKEFVLLMLSMREHVERKNESKDDINMVFENDARDAVLSESRNILFTEIIDILENVHDDYNPVTGRFGREPADKEERDALGTAYKDYIPLSDVKLPVDEFYTYRVPWGVIKKVIEAKSTKQNTISFRRFNKELAEMSFKHMRGYTKRGVERDIEIRLKIDLHREFDEKLRPILLDMANKKSKGVNKSEGIVDEDKKNPFGD